MFRVFVAGHEYRNGEMPPLLAWSVSKLMSRTIAQNGVSYLKNGKYAAINPYGG